MDGRSQLNELYVDVRVTYRGHAVLSQSSSEHQQRAVPMVLLQRRERGLGALVGTERVWL